MEPGLICVTRKEKKIVDKKLLCLVFPLQAEADTDIFQEIVDSLSWGKNEISFGEVAPSVYPSFLQLQTGGEVELPESYLALYIQGEVITLLWNTGGFPVVTASGEEAPRAEIWKRASATTQNIYWLEAEDETSEPV